MLEIGRDKKSSCCMSTGCNRASNFLGCCPVSVMICIPERVELDNALGKLKGMSRHAYVVRV